MRCPVVAGRCEKEQGHEDGHYTEYAEPVWSWKVETELGRAVQDGLDPERLRAAIFTHLRNYGLRPHKCNELCASELADEYVAAPPSKPVIGEVGEK